MTATWDDLGIDTRGRDTGRIKTTCPKCGPTRRNHRDLSLSVDLDRGLYHCHNSPCDFRGKLGGVLWMERERTPAYQKPDLGPGVLLPRTRAWLTERGIDLALAEAMGLQSNEADSAVAIPYYRNGELVHVKYRTFDKKFWSTENTEPVFYNLDLCDGAADVVIVEGEMDALSLLTAGVDAVLSVPNGAPGPGQRADGKLACMASGQEIFERARRVLIATDSDEPGQILADELIRRIGPEKCHRVRWIDGCKDANDVLLAYGEHVLVQCLADAAPVPIQGLIYARDIRDELWRDRAGSKERGARSGWTGFDRIYRAGDGHLTIVTGTPSSGKSQFLSALLVQQALLDPTRIVGVFSPEQGVSKRFFRYFVEMKAGKSLRTMSEAEYDDALGWVDRHFIRQAPEDQTLDAILDLARICVLRHGVRGIVIDPWTEVEGARTSGVNESEYIKESLTRIQKFGKQHETHMWVVAHPTKPDRMADDKPTGPYDISGSAHWFNKADAMLSVYREDREAWASPAQVIVLKMRDSDYGKVGMQRFGFDPPSGRYYEIANDGGK